MDKMKRFIDIAIPVRICNLNCEYCFANDFVNKIPKAQVIKAKINDETY